MLSVPLSLCPFGDIVCPFVSVFHVVCPSVPSVILSVPLYSFLYSGAQYSVIHRVFLEDHRYPV